MNLYEKIKSFKVADDSCGLRQNALLDKILANVSDYPEIDPDTQIAIIWSIEDVQSERSHLTDTQAMDVLENVKAKHDADLGVSWETPRIVADELYPE